jgi:redox-sensitive bicupin YhaK (pirin superfamily)
MLHRPAHDRGHASFGWLDSRHTFSFGQYHDPAHMGFGPLRVLNDDHVAPGAGFDTHGHRDMEIVSIILSGGLAHRDSTGTQAVINAGDVQRMTAGTGVLHSEFNASATDPVHFLQIWVHPEKTGLPPGYEQANFGSKRAPGTTLTLVSPDGRDGSVRIHQDAVFRLTDLAADRPTELTVAPGRRVWVQVLEGTPTLNGLPLRPGDGVGLTEPGPYTAAGANASLLTLDLG